MHNLISFTWSFQALATSAPFFQNKSWVFPNAQIEWTPLYFTYARHKSQTSYYDKLYWSHLSNILIVPKYLANEPSDKKHFTTPISNLCGTSANVKTLQVEQNWEEWACIFSAKRLCLFACSWYWKQISSSID